MVWYNFVLNIFITFSFQTLTYTPAVVVSGNAEEVSRCRFSQAPERD